MSLLQRTLSSQEMYISLKISHGMARWINLQPLSIMDKEDEVGDEKNEGITNKEISR